MASEPLMSLLARCNHGLYAIHYKLDKEFISLYPDHVVSRIKKIQHDLSIVKDQCQEILSAKQELLLDMIGSSASTSDAEEPAYDSFKEVIDEWTAQVQSRAGKEAELSTSDYINKLLFSAKVGG